jgi:hypothetical protein
MPVQLHTAFMADRVGLQESPNPWIIVAGAVIVKIGFNIESLAGEQVGIRMVRAVDLRARVDRILMRLDCIAVCITRPYYAGVLGSCSLSL